MAGRARHLTISARINLQNGSKCAFRSCDTNGATKVSCLQHDYPFASNSLQSIGALYPFYGSRRAPLDAAEDVKPMMVRGPRAERSLQYPVPGSDTEVRSFE
jgi:hypothetical protein